MKGRGRVREKIGVRIEEGRGGSRVLEREREGRSSKVEVEKRTREREEEEGLN